GGHHHRRHAHRDRDLPPDIHKLIVPVSRECAAEPDHRIDDERNLKRNQNSPIIASLTGRIANSAARPNSRSTTPSSTFCWIGSRRRLTSGKVIAPEPANNSMGTP